MFSFEHLAARLKNRHYGWWRATSVAHLRVQVMCQSCAEIDKRVGRHLELLRSTTDPAEIERIKRLISRLYADRVQLHQNPDTTPATW